MANITEAPEEKVELVLNGKLTPLTIENVFAFLKIFVDKSFKFSKALTIKEGAMLHHYFDLLTGQKKKTEQEPEIPVVYQTVLKAIDVGHNDGAFDTNDAAVMDKILTFIEKKFTYLFGDDEVDSETKITV